MEVLSNSDMDFDIDVSININKKKTEDNQTLVSNTIKNAKECIDTFKYLRDSIDDILHTMDRHEDDNIEPEYEYEDAEYDEYWDDTSEDYDEYDEYLEEKYKYEDGDISEDNQDSGDIDDDVPEILIEIADRLIDFTPKTDIGDFKIILDSINNMDGNPIKISNDGKVTISDHVYGTPIKNMFLDYYHMMVKVVFDTYLKIIDMYGEFRNSIYDILKYLLQKEGGAVTREELIYNCESINEDSSNKSIDVIIGRIRQKLNENPKEPKYIHAIRGIGYKLVL